MDLHWMTLPHRLPSPTGMASYCFNKREWNVSNIMLMVYKMQIHMMQVRRIFPVVVILVRSFILVAESYNGSFTYAGNKFISNFRICKGHAVYKSNFAVPTRELDVHPGPDDDRTVFLGLYDGENIFADKTGRHNHEIAAYGDRTSSPTPTATDSPIGITTLSPGLDRDVDNTFGPSFQGGAGYNSQNWLTLPKGTTTDRNRTGGRGISLGGAPSPSTA